MEGFREVRTLAKQHAEQELVTSKTEEEQENVAQVQLTSQNLVNCLEQNASQNQKVTPGKSVLGAGVPPRPDELQKNVESQSIRAQAIETFKHWWRSDRQEDVQRQLQDNNPWKILLSEITSLS